MPRSYQEETTLMVACTVARGGESIVEPRQGRVTRPALRACRSSIGFAGEPAFAWNSRDCVGIAMVIRTHSVLSIMLCYRFNTPDQVSKVNTYLLTYLPLIGLIAD